MDSPRSNGRSPQKSFLFVGTKRTIGATESRGRSLIRKGGCWVLGSNSKQRSRGGCGRRRAETPRKEGTFCRRCSRDSSHEGDGQGPVRGRQGHGGRHAGRRRRRGPPPQGLRHRRRLRLRPFPQRPHPHPREARRLPPRPQASQPRRAVPVHELGAGARQEDQPHLHPLHFPRPHARRWRTRGPRQEPRPHGARLRRGLRRGQQGQRLPHARRGGVPRQVRLRARRRAPHHHGALLRHRQQRLGVRRHQEVRRWGRPQGHLPRLHQAARARVDQEFPDWWFLQGCNNV